MLLGRKACAVEHDGDFGKHKREGTDCGGNASCKIDDHGVDGVMGMFLAEWLAPDNSENYSDNRKKIADKSQT